MTHGGQTDICRNRDGMWEPVQTHLFLQMILFDSKAFSSNESLPGKCPTETQLQFTFKIFYILLLCFSCGMEFLMLSKNLYTILQILLL